MTGRQRDVESAREQALAARARLTGTLAEIQQRLSPGSLAEDAIEHIRSGGIRLASRAVSVAKARPLVTVGLVAAVIGWLFRHSIIGLIDDIISKATATDVVDEGSEDVSVGDDPLYDAHPMRTEGRAAPISKEEVTP